MNDLEKSINEFISQCFTYPKTTDHNENLYHFTDLAALRSILHDRRLRFTYYRDLNDSGELNYGIKIVEKKLNNLHLQNKQLLIDLLKSFLNPSTKNLNTYICSFSKDYRHLPLWRFYGHNGYGIAIGFDSDLPLENQENLQKIQIPTRSNIFYGHKHLQRVINQKTSLLKKIFHKKSFKNLSSDVQLEKLRQIYTAFAAHLVGYSVCVKHTDYETEDEVRMTLMDGLRRDIIHHPSGYFFDCIKTLTPITVQKMNPNFEIISKTAERHKLYVNLSAFEKKAIKEIWVGPNCDNNLVSTIKLLLNQEGYPDNIQVKKHNSSFVG